MLDARRIAAARLAGAGGKVEREEWEPVFDATQTDALKDAAGHHLSRVAALADTEWKVTLAFWTVQIAGGATLLGAALGDRAFLVYANSGLILLAYLGAIAVFVFGFCVNQSQSISTERSRFLFYETAALRSVRVSQDALVVTRLHPSLLTTVPRSKVRRSIVWATKLAASTLFAFTSWGASVAVAAWRSTTFGPINGLWEIRERLWPLANLLVSTVAILLWAEMVIRFFERARSEAR